MKSEGLMLLSTRIVGSTQDAEEALPCREE
jgi:hypothetical protein